MLLELLLAEELETAYCWSSFEELLVVVVLMLLMSVFDIAECGELVNALLVQELLSSLAELELTLSEADRAFSYSIMTICMAVAMSREQLLHLMKSSFSMLREIWFMQALLVHMASSMGM